MGKIRSVFVLRFLFCVAALGLSLSSVNTAMAQGSDADELEELLDAGTEQNEVESEEEYALPVPRAKEEDSPVLNEASKSSTNPGEVHNEDLFLPVPSDQVAAPTADGETSEDFLPFYKSGDVRHDERDNGFRKPGWNLIGGASYSRYAANMVKDVKNGVEVGTHLRLLQGSIFKLPISAHGYADVTFTSLQDVSLDISNQVADTELVANGVKERMYRVGALFELELSRRFQLLGGVYKQFNEIESKIANRRTISTGAVDGGGNPTSYSADPIAGRLRENKIGFGGGVNWDFYVIPHASFGLRAWVEPSYFSILLSFAAEPVPKKRNSLDFDFDD